MKVVLSEHVCRIPNHVVKHSTTVGVLVVWRALSQNDKQSNRQTISENEWSKGRWYHEEHI